MSWWLARIYLCAAILNNVIAITTQSYVNPMNYYSNIGKRNKPRIGRNAEDSVEAQISVDEVNRILLGDKINESDKSYTTETRSLAAGDSFTPNEMLPIAERLFYKVDDPGNGHGFVSSSSSPQMLADKLFEAYFSTTKRIIFLKDEDLPGLDALQALALSGETVANTEAVEDDMYLKSRAHKMQPKRSKYKLVSKNVTRQESFRKPKHPNRRRINLTKNLNKKRHLIVNKRHNNQARNMSESNTSQTKVSSDFRKGNAGVITSIKPNCRWDYNCSNILNLGTCRIHSLCGKDASNKSINYEISKINEHGLESFRKMMKIHYVDEEVEKILESRNLQIRPSNSAVKEKVESLTEYFNKIIVEEKLGITKNLKTEINLLMGEQ